MQKPNNHHGRFCESDFEAAFISFLERAGWTYCAGNDIARESPRDVLALGDLADFLLRTSPDLSAEEIGALCDTVRLAGAESDFAVLHKVYGWMVNGIQFTPKNGRAKMISLIDFETPENNTFCVTNQFSVDYVNNGQTKTRRPDILLFVNGLPLCILELKNPADANATIHDAWEQIYFRYWRDIPHLLHFCPLACISDGAKTRLGTVRTPYEHFYAWRRVNDGDKISTSPFDEVQTMVDGVYAPARFLEIFRDYIYFQDSEYDRDEFEIVCRYPQFFAARLLKKSIIKSVHEKSGKGGTYFGATGCGKTYTMAFLARQLSLRCAEQIGSPTVIMIVDRDDLQKQGAQLFTKSMEFLGLGEVRVVPTRNILREELGARQSGGFYICTIQKFCDRTDDPIGLINDRANIICFSDEAHRTQLENAKRIKFSGDNSENMKALLSKPYAAVLRDALPHATFVGFTGTPIAETYQTFGEEIDRYTMDQAVADGLTVPIKYHPRIAKVLLDTEKVRLIEQYYGKCAEDGSTKEDIEASKKAMSSMEVILGERSRLERLAVDIHDHFTAACENDPERVQKAMVVSSKRETAFDLLCIFREKYPEWFEEKKIPDGVQATDEELKKLPRVPAIAMVASVGKNDRAEMYEYLGGVKNDSRSDKLAAAFKMEKSNFRIVIVVDMWITGFDVPCLTFLYNDKPLQKHTLIQTISRVNRKFLGKDYGFIIDYIGIRDNMREAMKIYGGGNSIAPTEDDVAQATEVFREELSILIDLFEGFDLAPFLNPDADPAERYSLLCSAAEFVFNSISVLNAKRNGGKDIAKVSFKTYFLETVKRMRLAYDVCQPSGGLGEEENALAQCFMAIAGFVRKRSGTDAPDTDVMNRAVSKMVEEALKYSKVESVLENGEAEDLFSPEFIERLSDIKMPATKLELLVKLLRRQIAEYKKTNLAAAKKYQEMLEQTITLYHERRKHLSEEEAGTTQEEASEEIIRNATKQALRILSELQEDRESFRKMGLTFEEKAFYDILIDLRNEHDFEYGTDEICDGILVNKKCLALAKKVKEIIDAKSSFADWLNNQNVRDQLKFDIKICLVKNGYPPKYSPEVFRQMMEQVENFKENE
ncbi:type I restriction endonuclease subunit R [Fibrobacter intestinalis]|uniref:Type I restriction enzyme endonuclease subunit n=1 Tax=Fibrobacter intestinalis TaxID=28122 RepID=A0A1T4L9G2_9BACT|nr:MULTISPECIES: HsdR family type I site-specific deoxyribonuclease [Fibrobacter]PBC73983.1 type I restriction enzyme R subunit [Fibrobacter sp. NR9]SJZ51147.1 type I restriction enzyme, R subunit [Fibrobacter intestinalis]